MSFIRRPSIPPAVASPALSAGRAERGRALAQRDVANAALGVVCGALVGMVLSLSGGGGPASPFWPAILGVAGAATGYPIGAIGLAIRRRRFMMMARRNRPPGRR